jgi:GTP1/Obg family GTP-binding protein
MEFDPESYEWRINNFLQLIRRQNEQQAKEDAWLDIQSKKHKFISKQKRKTKNQVRKEQLQKLKTQVPKIGNVSKFFNF